MRTVVRSEILTDAPIFRRMSNAMVMSLMGGMFSKTDTPPTKTVANTIGNAAFFIPLIGTSPISGLPPSIMILFDMIRLSQSRCGSVRDKNEKIAQ